MAIDLGVVQRRPTGTGDVYWFGIVKHLNKEEEQIVSLNQESTELVLLSGLTILKKGIDE